MKFILLFYTAVAVVLGASNADISDRIAGGTDADISNFPYLVQLEYNDEFVCGATLVASHIAITAGQYVVSKYVENFLVRAGTSTLSEGGQEILINTVVSHPQYEAGTNNYGVALLILSESVNVANAQPIPLATTDDAIVEGANVLVAGWGWQEFVYYTEFSTTLQSIQLPILGDEQCKSAYDIVTDVMFCAAYLSGEGQGFCWGDAGGPAVINGVLVGVMSFGQGCGDGTHAGVLIRVSKIREWVEGVIEKYQVS